MYIACNEVEIHLHQIWIDFDNKIQFSRISGKKTSPDDTHLTRIMWFQTVAVEIVGGRVALECENHPLESRK